MSRRQTFATVPEYLEALAPSQASALRRVLATARRAVPGAMPVISYGIPALRKERVFIYCAAFKHHIGIYPPVGEDARLRAALQPYANAKGNLAFPLDEALPLALIGRVAKALARQGAPKDAGRRGRSGRAKGAGAAGSREVSRIRRASVRDATAVARLCAQLGYPVPDAVMDLRLRQLLRSPRHRLVVAEQGAMLQGWATGELRLTVESGLRAEITGLVVDAGARRGGVGRALVAALEQWAREQGCEQIVVRSNVARGESHPFYLRLGYARNKTQHVYRRLL